MDTARVEFVQVLKAGFNNWGSRGSGGAPELMNYSASALLFRADHEPPRQHKLHPVQQCMDENVGWVRCGAKGRVGNLDTDVVRSSTTYERLEVSYSK